MSNNFPDFVFHIQIDNQQYNSPAKSLIVCGERLPIKHLIHIENNDIKTIIVVRFDDIIALRWNDLIDFFIGNIDGFNLILLETGLYVFLVVAHEHIVFDV